MTQKLKSLVVPETEGQAFWQPGVKGNCITVKTSPWNIDKTKHTVFTHELPYGGEVKEHLHLNDDEIFICLDGEGCITIDGIQHPFEKHSIAFVGAGSKHKIQTLSKDPLKFVVISSPPGLEERFKLIGIPKLNINEEAPEAFTSEFAQQNTHGVIR